MWLKFSSNITKNVFYGFYAFYFIMCFTMICRWRLAKCFLIICDWIWIYPMFLVYANRVACVCACLHGCFVCMTGPHGRAVFVLNGFTLYKYIWNKINKLWSPNGHSHGHELSIHISLSQPSHVKLWRWPSIQPMHILFVSHQSDQPFLT